MCIESAFIQQSSKDISGTTNILAPIASKSMRLSPIFTRIQKLCEDPRESKREERKRRSCQGALIALSHWISFPSPLAAPLQDWHYAPVKLPLYCSLQCEHQSMHLPSACQVPASSSSVTWGRQFESSCSRSASKKGFKHRAQENK